MHSGCTTSLAGSLKVTFIVAAVQMAFLLTGSILHTRKAVRRSMAIPESREYQWKNPHDAGFS